MKGRWWRQVGGGEYFAGLVLCDFVLGMFLAVFAFAVGAAGFGYVDLDGGDSLAEVLMAGIPGYIREKRRRKTRARNKPARDNSKMPLDNSEKCL